MTAPTSSPSILALEAKIAALESANNDLRDQVLNDMEAKTKLRRLLRTAYDALDTNSAARDEIGIALGLVVPRAGSFESYD